MEKINIYPTRVDNYQKEIKRLERSEIPQYNKDIISRFGGYMMSMGNVGGMRASKLMGQLRRLCEIHVSKKLSELNVQELEQLLTYINTAQTLSKSSKYTEERYISDTTKADYRRCLKQFFKWYKKQDVNLDNEDFKIRKEAEKKYEYIDEISIATKIKQADPKTIITDAEIDIVLEKGCTNAKEQCFISLLHETGTRAGEILNIRIGDIEIKDKHAEVNVDGKTGQRVIFIIRSLPYLIRWMESTPCKEHTDPLFITNCTSWQFQPLRHVSAQKLVNKVFYRAGITKKHNLHWFRHSRASILASKITTPVLCKLMGWSLNSRQIKTYCHLCVKDIHDAYLGIYGVKEEEEEQKEVPIKCICGTLNSKTERYCYKCHKPLSQEVIVQDKEIIDDETSKTIRAMMEMMKDPKDYEEFMKWKSSISVK
jgi:integrase/recombinase XerD